MLKFFQTSEIRPNLHITGYGKLTDEKIKNLGYSHAVDVTNEYKIHSKKGVKYFNVNVDDSATTEIQKHFNDAANFIQDAMDEGGKVLVFCRHGMSRSVTICIMYLVIKENLLLKNAFIEIHKVRPFIEPNLGFWKQMIEYEEKIRGKASVNIIEAARMNKELV